MNVELQSVAYAYAGRRSPSRQAAELSFCLESGTMAALVGPSGAGKSTLLQGLQGFLKPVFGRLLLDGVDPWRSRGRRLFGRVATLLQNPSHQLFAATVGLDVAYGLAPLRLGPRETGRRVEKALARVGLDVRVASRSPWELSGGEKRRVALAGVLAPEPEVLLLDEPTAGLDAGSRRSLLVDLQNLASHDLEEVWVHAPRVLVMEASRLTADASPSILLKNRELAERLGWDTLPALALARRWGVEAQPDPEILAQRIVEAARVQVR